MDENIDLLLLAYEDDKKTLIHLIESCLKEEEYLLAHYHSEALYLVNRNIHMIMTFKNRHYYEIEMHKRTVSINTDLLNQAFGNEFLTEMITQNITRDKKRIEQLESASEQLRQQKIENHFDQALASLLDRKIKYIKLYLKKKDDFYLKITFSKKTLHISLSSIKKHIKSWFLNDVNIQALKTSGFVLSKSENILTNSIRGSREQIFTRSRIIISKIVFEIFYFRQFDYESFLEIG